MENKNNNHESGNGFLFGVILGSIATLLFTTKKGREIVKDLTEKGIEKFSDLEDRLKETQEAEVIENDYIEPEERSLPVPEPDKTKLAKESVSNAAEANASAVKPKKVNTEKRDTVPSPKTPRTVKRFFRKRG